MPLGLRAAWAALLIACGGAQVARAPAVDPDAATRRAAEAWAGLDPEAALREAERALEAGGGPDAREIAARAALALGRPERAVRALAGIEDEALLRLRGAAQIAAGDRRGALATLEAAERRARAPDPWASAMIPALRAAPEPYAVEGAEATLPLAPFPLPVVSVRVDTVETLAILGSGAHVAVLDPSIRNAPGAIDELGLGALRVRGVPHVVRSLEAISAALGAEIGMVIGAELLLRLAATLDGPGGRVTFRASPPSSGGTSAPCMALGGSFLAAPATLDGRAAWLTLDTAGAYPLALTPAAAEGLEGWRSDAVTVGALRLGALQVEDIPALRGVLDEGHARAVAAPVSGSVGWGLLGQLVVTFHPGGRIVFEGSRFEEAAPAP